MTQAAGGKFSQWVRGSFKPEFLLPGLVAGVLIGFSEIIDDISLGSLVFSGELSRYLAFGFSIALTTSIVLMIVSSLASSVPGMVSGTQETVTKDKLILAVKKILKNNVIVSHEGE